MVPFFDILSTALCEGSSTMETAVSPKCLTVLRHPSLGGLLVANWPRFAVDGAWQCD
jgi:hypothetical protein